MKGTKRWTSSIRLTVRSMVSSAHCSGSQQPRERKKVTNVWRTFSCSTAARSRSGLRSVINRSQASTLSELVRRRSLDCGFLVFSMLPSHIYAWTCDRQGNDTSYGLNRLAYPRARSVWPRTVPRRPLVRDSTARPCHQHQSGDCYRRQSSRSDEASMRRQRAKMGYNPPWGKYSHA